MKKAIYSYTPLQQKAIDLTSQISGISVHECNCKCGNNSKSCRKGKHDH